MTGNCHVRFLGEGLAAIPVSYPTYVAEYEAKSFARSLDTQIVKNPCPASGNTKRQEIKELILSLNKTYPNLSQKIFGAITRGLPDWKLNNGRGDFNA